MKKQFFLFFIPIFIFASGDEVTSALQRYTSEPSIFEEIDQMEKQMERVTKKLIEEEEKFMPSYKIFDSLDAHSQQTIKINVKDEVNFLIVELIVPELSDKGIEVSAKDKQLEGSLQTKSGGRVTFGVYEDKNKHQYFKISYSLESKKSSDKDGKQVQHFMANQMTQTQYLSVPVGNLEEAVVEPKGNALFLKLPKIDAKKDWKKIKVG